MNKIMVLNNENGKVLADKGREAKRFGSRLKGLLGKRSMLAGEGLLICPCNMIHTIGMRMVIDVLFVSQDYEIVHLIQSMKPGKISPCIHNASYVIELPAGQIQSTDTYRGNRISIHQLSE